MTMKRVRTFCVPWVDMGAKGGGKTPRLVDNTYRSRIAERSSSGVAMLDVACRIGTANPQLNLASLVEGSTPC